MLATFKFSVLIQDLKFVTSLEKQEIQDLLSQKTLQLPAVLQALYYVYKDEPGTAVNLILNSLDFKHMDISARFFTYKPPLTASQSIWARCSLSE